MKKNLKKSFVLLLVIPILMISCEEENDITPPGTVENEEAVAQDQSVLIQWNDPADTDLDHIKIIYTNEIEYIVEVPAGIEQKLIEDLVNNTTYSFELKAIDKSGNESDIVELTSIPKLKVFQLSGTEIENGTYKNIDDESGFIITMEFSGTNILNSSLTAGDNFFSWTGTWERKGFSMIIEIKSNDYDATYRDSLSGAFCFVLDGEKYFYRNAFRKVEGEKDELEGYYIYTTTDKNGETYERWILIDEDGSFEVADHEETINSGNWTNDDIRNNNYIFIDFMDERFLYCDDSFVFIKQ